MKKHDVLVINKSWAPCHIITARKAMKLIVKAEANCLDRDFVIYSFNDWLEHSHHLINKEKHSFVTTVRYAIAMPEIIVLTRFNKLPPNDVKYSRQNVFSRDNFKCAYCGEVFKKYELTIDHIVPRAQGGKTIWKNVISSCFPCNQRKADRTPEEANMRLKFKPSKPQWFSPLAKVDEKHPCKSWKHFMPNMDVSSED